MTAIKFAVAWLMLAAVVFTAQTPAASESLVPGARVRVRIPDARRQEGGKEWLELRGTIFRAVPDTLVLTMPPAEGTLAIPREAMTSLAVSRGMPSRFAHAVHGVPFWALVGAILGAVANVGDEGGFDWGTVGVWAGCATAFGLGADALWPTESWREVPVESVLAARVSF